MKWYKGIIWLYDLTFTKIEKENKEKETSVRLERIESKIDRIESKTIPMGILFAGIPILMIGFYSFIANILDKKPSELRDYVTFAIGAFLVSLGLGWLKNKVRFMLLYILVTATIILINWIINPPVNQVIHLPPF